MTGRPTKLDDLRAKRIMDAVREGNTFASAAQAAGIDPSTLHDWRARGRSGTQPFADFSERLEKARAEAEAKMVRVIRTAAETGTWQAAAWWLERRRKGWARKDLERRQDANAGAPLVPRSDEDRRATALGIVEGLVSGDEVLEQQLRERFGGAGEAKGGGR